VEKSFGPPYVRGAYFREGAYNREGAYFRENMVYANKTIIPLVNYLNYQK
jgi:hypothetical protein